MAEGGMRDAAGRRDRWAQQVAALDQDPSSPARRPPLSTARIVETALRLVEHEGYEAVTMRRVAQALSVSPGALYAHVRDKAELDDRMIGELCSRVVIPTADATDWRSAALDISRGLRDQYLQHPGIARATFRAAPQSPDTMRLMEGMLGCVIGGGVAPERAAWFADAVFLYIAAYSVMSLRRHPDDAEELALDRSDVIEQFRMLPVDRFPMIHAHTVHLVSGDGHERFDFVLELLLDGLAPPRA